MRDQDELLKLYLLGDLEEEEESRLEARLIQEDELFESLEAAEADLLDEYAHGGLSPEERGQLERRLLSSPQARQRLAVIRGLGEIAEEESNGRRVLPGPWGGKKLSLPQMRVLAAAAMLVIAVGSGVISRQTAQHPVPPQEPPPIPADETTPPPPPIPDDEPDPAEPGPEPVPTPEPVTWTLPIKFDVERGGGQIEEIVIPAGTERVELRLDLDGELNEHRRYTVKLVDNGTLFTDVHEGLQPREIDGKPLLVLQFDVDRLKEHMSVEIYEDGAQTPFVTKEFDFRRQDG
jgi:hypothetical protein